MSVVSDASHPQRVRRGLAVLGTVMCLLPLTQLVARPASSATSVLSGVAGLGLVAIIGWTVVRHGAYLPVTVPLGVGLTLLAGTGLDDPVSVVGLCIGQTVALTMIGPWRLVLLRTLLLLPVVPLVVILSRSPVGSAMSWHAPGVLTPVPSVAVFAGLLLMLRQALAGQTATIARANFAARLSSRLLTADSIGQVSRAMVTAYEELDDLSPGVITLMLRRFGPGEPGPTGAARVVMYRGDVPGGLPDVLPAEAFEEMPPAAVVHAQPLRTGSDVLGRLGLPQRRWHAFAVERSELMTVDLVLHGVSSGRRPARVDALSPEEHELLALAQIMTTLWRAALVRVSERAALIVTQEQDGVTGLPDRSATIRQVVDRVRDGDVSALMLFGLSGLDRIEAESGITAVDDTMGHFAARVVDVVEAAFGPGAYVGRAGNASLVVLVPETRSAQDVETLAGELRSAVQEPVVLSMDSVHLEVRVSLAWIKDGDTGMDLLERAAATLTPEPSDVGAEAP